MNTPTRAPARLWAFGLAAGGPRFRALLRGGGAVLLMVCSLPLAPGCQAPEPPPFAVDQPLLINEVVADNDGVWLDEVGEADDFIELLNDSDHALRLSDYALSDNKDNSHQLPDMELGPGQTILVWADATPAQGPLHLPFRLDAAGETIYLWQRRGPVLGRVPYPALDINTSFARTTAGSRATSHFGSCRYPTPARPNATCAPPRAAELSDDVTFPPFTWPAVWPPLPTPMAITEIALRPSPGEPAFVEVANTGSNALDLSGFALRLAPHKPGQVWPGVAQGRALPWPAPTLAPGARLLVPVQSADVAALQADPRFEGVVTLWAEQRPLARIDFMDWPPGATLAADEGTARLRFCARTTPAARNDTCDPLVSRPVGDRLRNLHTPGDFAALAAGSTALAQHAVKFIVDLDAGGVVHFLGTKAWPLHYNFVRELVDGEPRLDLCDPQQHAEFRAAWVQFSAKEYFVAEGRRYLLGTLVQHAGTDVRSIEFAVGDAIVGTQMKQAFFAVAARLADPKAWTVRPQTPGQVAAARAVETQLPLIGPNTPFRAVTYQPLSPAVGFGILRFVPASELARTALDPQTILITDDVPNDIDLVGGLITETFQTPLAHVNVLSTGRGTPNMSLRDARLHPRVAPLLDQPVRLEVRADGFDLRAATSQEVQEYWQTRFGGAGVLTARIDLSERRLLPLSQVSLADIPRFGAKAAQLAELARVRSNRAECPGDMGVPQDGFAIPLAHAAEHAQRSGAQRLIDALLAAPDVRADVSRRNGALADIRAAILGHPVDPALHKELEKRFAATFGTRRVRLRSSSNAEDLSDFNGAGLYQSVAVASGDPERKIADGLRAVWASLWSARAFAERELARLDHASVGMGVLVHEAFPSELVNGVAVSRNVLDPNDGDIFYINAQKGEASVTNPAPGITTEQMLYRWYRDPPVLTTSLSSFSPTTSVMSPAEVEQLACRLAVISNHFRPLLDPKQDNRWFAMEVEFKVVRDGSGGANRRLVIKQTRPYNFGRPEILNDCRERL